MLGTAVRPIYQHWLVDPLAKKLATYCHPNQLTYAAGVIGTLAAGCVALQWTLLATLLLLLSGYCDTLDGTVARLQNTASSTGAVLDIVIDRWVEFVIVFGLFAVDPSHRAVLSMLMLGSILICITSFLVVGIFSTNESEKSFHYSPGWVERTEAFFLFLLMMWLPRYFNVLAGLFTVFVFLTAIVRIKQFMQQSRS